MGRSYYLNSFRHCRARARRRYGVVLDLPDYTAMNREIESGRAQLMQKVNGDWFVEFRWNDIDWKGVWDGKRLCTLLPKDAERPFPRVA